MADYIRMIRTKSGDKQIDYNALANLPDIEGMISKANTGVLNNGTVIIYKTDTANPYTYTDSSYGGTKTWQYRATVGRGSIGQCIIFKNGNTGYRIIIRLDYPIESTANGTTWAITVLEGELLHWTKEQYGILVDPLYNVSGSIRGDFVITDNLDESFVYPGHGYLAFNGVFSRKNFVTFPYISAWLPLPSVAYLIDLTLKTVIAISGKLDVSEGGSDPYMPILMTGYQIELVSLNRIENVTYGQINPSISAASGDIYVQTIIPGIGTFYK